MLRRMIAAAFALAALLIPVGATSAVADEYGPDEFPCTIEVDSAVATEGESIQVDITCSEAVSGTVYLYAADGTVIDQMDLDLEAGETEMFSITDLTAGEYTIELTDADGNALAAAVTLTVTSDAPGVPGDDGSLAATGPTSMPYLVTAGALVLVGVAALVVTRRARSRA